jgi:transcription elongation factor Elf1
MYFKANFPFMGLFQRWFQHQSFFQNSSMNKYYTQPKKGKNRRKKGRKKLRDLHVSLGWLLNCNVVNQKASFLCTLKAIAREGGGGGGVEAVHWVHVHPPLKKKQNKKNLVYTWF